MKMLIPIPPRVPSRRLPSLPVCCMLGAWALLAVGMCVRCAVQPHYRSVYPAFSDAGRCWVRGADNYDDHFWEQKIDQYRYAPLVTIGFVPLSVLPDEIGGMLWRLINMAVLFAGVVTYCRAVWPGAARIGAGGAAAIGGLLMPLSLPSLNNGQANPLVIGLLLLGVAAAYHGRWNWAALALAGPIFLKLYPLASALLLLLIYPRQLGWRLAIVLALGMLLPFAAQHPSHVAHQYDQWFTKLAEESRSVRVFEDAYRDLGLLLRVAGFPLATESYRLLQAGAGVALAAIVLLGRLRRMALPDLLHACVNLGCCWMTLLGPATENSTYILVAPTFALAIWEGFAERRPVWTRGLLAVIFGVCVGGAFITALPGGRNWAYPMYPLATLLLFVERLLSLGTRTAHDPGLLVGRPPFSKAA